MAEVPFGHIFLSIRRHVTDSTVPVMTADEESGSISRSSEAVVAAFVPPEDVKVGKFTLTLGRLLHAVEGDPEGDLAVDVTLVGVGNNLVHQPLEHFYVVANGLLYLWCVVDLDGVGDHGGLVLSPFLEKCTKPWPGLLGVRSHLS